MKPGPKPRFGPRKSLTFRIQDGPYQRLVDAAARSGLSLSEEIERRIVRSFDAADIVEEVLRLMAERAAQ